jgi:hypothetical protein
MLKNLTIILSSTLLMLACSGETSPEKNSKNKKADIPIAAPIVEEKPAPEEVKVKSIIPFTEDEVSVAMRCRWPNDKPNEYRFDFFFSKNSRQAMYVYLPFYNYSILSLTSESIDSYVFQPISTLRPGETLASLIRVEINRQSLAITMYYQKTSYNQYGYGYKHDCFLLDSEAKKKAYSNIQLRYDNYLEENQKKERDEKEAAERDAREKIKNQKI